MGTTKPKEAKPKEIELGSLFGLSPKESREARKQFQDAYFNSETYSEVVKRLGLENTGTKGYLCCQLGIFIHKQKIGEDFAKLSGEVSGELTNLRKRIVGLFLNNSSSGERKDGGMDYVG